MTQLRPVCLLLLTASFTWAAEPVALRLTPLTSISGTTKWDWWQARAAHVPGPRPLWDSPEFPEAKGIRANPPTRK